jgi:hypothetical protein
MKHTLKLMLGITAMFVLYSSCRKFDFHRRDPVQHCRITHITERVDNDHYHKTISYNDHGDPISVTYPENEQGTGNAEYIFEYDDQRRLIHYTGFSDHRLFYNSHGQVATDSVFANYAGQQAYFEDKFHYDIYGRISKIVSTYYFSATDDPLVGAVETTEYNYDSHGNLIKELGGTYTTKPSIYRTHPVWMFVNRNYSINNESGPVTYNQAGLPLEYGPSFQIFLDKGLGGATIEYDCNPGKH